ncbi:MAG: DUF1553 domain-containing protein [Verrucomicrobiota bacterium]
MCNIPFVPINRFIRVLLACIPMGALAESSGDKRAGEDWWSLQALVRPEPPPSAAWDRNPIDAYIRVALSAKKLSPAPEADRRTLMRRLSFDLLGLPPSPADLDRFIRDESPQAYEHLVDRLLDSPHYGERWTRHWLDVVRFGESHGFEYNQPRQNAWPYRNWVIDALNRDMPYDEFVRFQIAGDVITKNAADGVIATGFLVAGPHNTTRPSSDPMRKTMLQDEVEGMIAVVGQTFLGLTVNCARCHDHKFDPVSQKDYYQMAAALAGVTPNEQKVTPAVSVPFKEEADQLKLERRKLQNQDRGIVDPVRKAILAERVDHPEAQAEAPPATAAWDFTQGLEDEVASLHIELKHGAKLDERGIRLDGKQAYAASRSIGIDLKEKTLEVWVQLDDINQRGGGAISVQTLNGNIFDAIVYGEREKQRWMAGSNGFVRYSSFKGPEEKDAKGRPVHFAMVYRQDGTIIGYRDGQAYGQGYKSRGLQSYAAADAQVIFGLRHGTGPAGGRMLKGSILKARLYDRALDPAAIEASAGRSSTFVSETAILKRLGEEQRTQLDALRTRRDAIEKRIAEIESRNTPMPVWAVRPGNPGRTHVLTRGSVLTPGEEVAAAGITGLRALSADFGLKLNAPDADRRRKLAEWITHPDNPLFARVIVNRLWHHHFGAGIVSTPNDFGFNGGRPTHPDLLDWLAVEMREKRWSLKAIHRLIVQSATYRQSAAMNEQARKVDADNRYLWHMTPRRLEAEALRDALLMVSGKLVPDIGGKGYRDVREYKFKGSHFYDLIPQDKPEQFRRTLYRFSPRGAKRTILDVFDCPDPSAITPNRAVTTTPLQSLALMNNPLVLFLADAFADRIRREVGTETDAQVRQVHLLAYGRVPGREEIDLTREFITSHNLEAYCRVVFNSNEFLYVR